jgi:lipid-A-disaccharide synthase
MKYIFISAGETSGDVHAATVVAEIRQRFPDMQVHGLAGTQMVEAGCHMLCDMHELNVMGLTDVFRALPRIRRIEKSALSWCEEHQPTVAVLVDFSSFHMRLGRKLRAMGIPVLHFIAPKLWAWGAWRVSKLKKSQDRLACILPFEPEWFSKCGISAAYVGNPSVQTCMGGWSREELKIRLGIGTDMQLLALLPGSRPQELKAHVAVLTEVWQRIHLKIPNIACVVPVAPGIQMGELQPLWDAGAMPLLRTEADYALRADAAVAVSGTATLELALWNVPSVLIYRASPLMAFMARRLVKLNCAGLANIILGDKAVMPELIQEACSVDAILSEVLPLLQDAERAQAQCNQFSLLQTSMGDAVAAAGVVDIMTDLINKKST